jgi:hypothetical protein
MKQKTFEHLLFMAKNEIATPFVEGAKRELVINQIYIDFAKRYKIDTKNIELFKKRQNWLRQQLKQRERE